MHISILLLDHVNLAGLENARSAFQECNQFLLSQNEQPFFDIELVGQDKSVQLYNGRFTVQPDKLLDEIDTTDLIVIPPVQRNLEQAIRANTSFFDWINVQHQRGAQVASLCLGAFILASTGLLNSKKCATHWLAAEQFKENFPEVELVPDQLLTDDNGIYTGAGAFSSAHLILYIIEKNLSREAALYCSKIFQVDWGRESQSPFIIFRGQKSHGDDLVLAVQSYIEKNYSGGLTTGQLIKNNAPGTGRRTLERRFGQATGNTIQEYIKRVRVEAAKRKLENGVSTVSEVMYTTGYSDANSFRKVFKKFTGMTPLDYKRKYVRKAD